jgi:hypothetical protein
MFRGTACLTSEGRDLPYSTENQAKAREAKRLSARRRRRDPGVREAEGEANRKRNQAKRDGARPKPVTDADFLKDAARFGPANEAPLDQSSLKGVSVGFWLKGKSQRISISETDEHPAAVGTIGTLESIVLGKGYDYNPENTFGEPLWWLRGYRHHGMPIWWKVETDPDYRGDERRWVLYCLSFRRRNWGPNDGRAAETRGIEIAATLNGETRDVRWVAGWLRDGKSHVPPRSATQMTKERVESAKRRLKALGLLKQIGNTVRIQ